MAKVRVSRVVGWSTDEGRCESGSRIVHIRWYVSSEGESGVGGRSVGVSRKGIRDPRGEMEGMRRSTGPVCGMVLVWEGRPAENGSWQAVRAGPRQVVTGKVNRRQAGTNPDRNTLLAKAGMFAVSIRENGRRQNCENQYENCCSNGGVAGAGMADGGVVR